MRTLSKKYLVFVILVAGGCLAYACAYRPVNRISIEGSDKSGSQLQIVIAKSWMQRKEVVAEEVVRGLRKYLSEENCTNAECVERFGFDDCYEEFSSYYCEYKTDIHVRHGQESSRAGLPDVIECRVILSIKEGAINLSINRSGGPFNLR